MPKYASIELAIPVAGATHNSHYVRGVDIEVNADEM